MTFELLLRTEAPRPRSLRGVINHAPVRPLRESFAGRITKLTAQPAQPAPTPALRQQAPSAPRLNMPVAPLAAAPPLFWRSPQFGEPHLPFVLGRGS